MTYELTTLGEYAKVQGGYAYKSSDFKSHGNYPVLKIKNIRFGTVDYQDAAFISRELAEVTHEWKTQEGDILISMTGSGPNAPNSLVGRAARVWKSEPDAWINQRVGRLVLHKPEAIHPDVLFYALSLPSSQSYLVSNSSGSANQANISGKTIESLPCPRIDYEPSKVIAKILRNLDEKIILNRKTNETLEGMAQAIFKSWFVDFDPVKAKIVVLESGGSVEDARLAAMQAISGLSVEDLDTLRTQNEAAYAELKSTAEAFPSAFTDSPLGPIPEGWEFKRIEDSINRLSVGKKFSSRTASPKGKVPILDQGKSGLIGFHDEEPGVKASPEDPVIVFANHTCYMRLIMHDFSAIQNVLPFKPKDTHILWLYYATQGKQGFVEYKGHWPDFAIKEIIIPNNNLDEIYARYISSAVKQIFANELENQSLAETRDALLPKLLSGEIDVSAFNDMENSQ